ncbi:MAG: hypothetical protein HUU26_08050 [Gemmatimonadaceae bacterium]|nr:hypothetical protein [Gemmatimonadaceae bacterium]
MTGPDIVYQQPASQRPSLDPLRYCVMTTVALLAWLLSPPVMVIAMGGLGFWMYWGAVRGGLRRTRCVLRHPRLVLGYLAAAVVAGIAGLLA